jgi:hypothetical protein
VGFLFYSTLSFGTQKFITTMFKVYALYSERFNKIYIGMTSNLDDSNLMMNPSQKDRIKITNREALFIYRNMKKRCVDAEETIKKSGRKKLIASA